LLQALDLFARASETLLLIAMKRPVTAGRFIALFIDAASRTQSIHSRLHPAASSSGSFVSGRNIFRF
jgi:hypothetical protein